MPATIDQDSAIDALVNEMRHASGLEGAAVIDLSQPDMPVSHLAGSAGRQTIAFGRALLTRAEGRPAHAVGHDGRPVLACPWVLPPFRPGGLVLWRGPNAGGWDDSDHPLALAAAALLRAAIAADIGQVGVDRLTGLPNRRWFLEEADRHIHRLEGDEAVGSLTLIDIDDLLGLNAAHGRASGDRALVRVAAHLRAVVRPNDLVGRVGPDEFAIWQDRVDRMTAAERASALCRNDAFGELRGGQRLTFSVGIAERRPKGLDNVRALLRRAHQTARDIGRNGGNGWRVAEVRAARLHNKPPG